MRLLLFIIISSLLAGFFSLLSAQEITDTGTPAIENFNKNEIVTAGKIWQIDQAPNRILYMAGDAGLIEYDGHSWRNFRGSKGFTRSVIVVNDSLIYTGSDMDFGYWKRNPDQSFHYTSLYPYKENSHGVIEEFWHIAQHNNSFIFQSHENVYVYENEHLVKIPAPGEFTGLFTVNDRILMTDKKGIFNYDGFKLIPFISFSENFQPDINGISFRNNTWQIFTLNQGIFMVEGNQMVPSNHAVNRVFSTDRIFSHSRLKNGYEAAGSILNGLYITNSKGDIIQHINRKKGLTHNTVLAVFEDKSGNLWVSLDYGLSRIRLNSPYTYFIDHTGSSGTVETAVLWNDRLYLGTNQGLYTADWNKLKGSSEVYDHQLVEGSEGQIWSLQLYDNKLLIGHDRGLFEYSNGNMIHILDDPGILDIHPWKNNFLIAGTYNGLDLLQKSEGKWKFIKKFDGIAGACKQIVQQNENFWINIPNYGIVKLKIDGNLEITGIQNLLLKDVNLNNFELKSTHGHIDLVSHERHLRLNSATNQFKSVSVAFPPPENSIRSKPQRIKLSEIYDMIPVHNGFAIYRQTGTSRQSVFQPIIRQAVYFNNKERKNFLNHAKIPFNSNNLRFQVVNPGEDFSELKYKLINGSDTVSGNTKSGIIELLDLSSGKYQLYLGENTGKHLKPFHFTILRPIWFSWWAVLIYLALLAGIIYLINYYHRLRLKKQKLEMLKRSKENLREQAEKYERELQRAEQQQMENDRLELENRLKEKTLELTSLSKENRDKRNVLKFIRDQFNDIEENPASAKAKHKMTEIRRNLDDFFRHEEDHTFEIQIDELHQEFYRDLKKNFPDLTTYDLRLAVYLKLGMSTKEIAEILDVLPSSINVSRSRLRKKLNLRSDEDLYVFLNNIHS